MCSCQNLTRHLYADIWHGQLRAVGEEGGVEDFDVVLQVTRVGKQDVISVCPWMKEVGCSFVLGKGSSYLTLGHQSIVTVPELKELSDTLISEIILPSHVSEIVSLSSFPTDHPQIPKKTHIRDTNSTLKTKTPSKFSASKTFPNQQFSPVLSKLCSLYSHIFSLQDSVLPPHRPYDIEIELKPGCDTTFGGL